MIQSANYNRLTISRQTDNGLYLTDGEETEVLLPNRYVPETYEIGDPIEVFVYHDSEDRLVATTEHPNVIEGGIAVLEAVGSNDHGAFMDWGLPKDLFVPKSNQSAPVRAGGRYAVSVYIDNVTGRPVGTTRLNKIVSNQEITVRPKEEVDIIVAQRQERGYRVIVNKKHWGMLYDNQIFNDVKVGDVLKGYVRKITEDDRIDIALQQEGLEQVKAAAAAVLRLLEEHGGRLPIGDRSDPGEVQFTTGLSKKVFKRAVGYLMSRGMVRSGEKTTEKAG